MSMPPPEKSAATAAAAPQPNNKRPRPSGGAASSASATGNGATGSYTDYPPAASRSKRKKPDTGSAAVGENGVPLTGPGSRGGAARGRNRAAQASENDKDKDEDGEVGEGEIITKIDFKTLPPETLYKYLEQHELLPKWGEESPWSESPVTQPHMIYAAPPKPIAPSPPAPAATTLPDTDRAPSLVPTLNPSEDIDMSATLTANGETPVPGAEDEEAAPAPTTRSKTAPTRRAPTPPRTTSPGPDYRTRVITLSDVIAARDVLAEKANAHWAKGLGGGQNKESETIVNFLYKMKVGPGRLLRVYNPAYPAYGNHAQ